MNCDVEGLTRMIEQVGERVVRGISAMMVEQADKIVDKARSNAPVLTESLENAIDYKDTRTGLHGRTEVKIFVDGSAIGANGKPVGEYAKMVHEELAPYGSGSAGDVHNPDYPDTKSKQKAAAGNDVGGKFLERAFEERRNVIKHYARRVAAEVKV